MADLGNLPVIGRFFGGKKAEGAQPAPVTTETAEPAAPAPAQEPKPLDESTSEVTPPPAAEPVNEPAAELNPQASTGTEAMGSTGVNQPEASPTPTVEGAQSPTDSPEGQ